MRHPPRRAAAGRVGRFPRSVHPHCGQAGLAADEGYLVLAFFVLKLALDRTNEAPAIACEDDDSLRLALNSLGEATIQVKDVVPSGLGFGGSIDSPHLEEPVNPVVIDIWNLVPS